MTISRQKITDIHYDLHSHSHCSDGQLSPSDLVQQAIQCGVTHLALTDHDTIDGVERAKQAAEGRLALIPGIEFSCTWRKRTIHILGLNIDPKAHALLKASTRLKHLRYERAEKIADKLTKAGIPNSLDGAAHYAGEGVMTRPHFAQFLVDAGYVSSISKAFSQYLANKQCADVTIVWPDISDTCHWIRQAGGQAIIAHPDKYNLTRTKLIELIRDFISFGGQGLEVISGNQCSTVTEKLSILADQHELLASKGSDFHRMDQPWQALGITANLPARCTPVWDFW